MQIRGKFEPVPAAVESIHGRLANQDAEAVDCEDSTRQSVDSSERETLRRSLTYMDGVAIIVGIIIGSGIFSSPGLALDRSGSAGLCLVAWIASGLLVALTSQCYFELGAMMPTAGGDFDYLERAYGPQAAFSFAWFNFFISKTGSQAITSTVFGSYLTSAGASFLGYGELSAETQRDWTKLLAVLQVLGLFSLNCLGLRESTMVQNVLTVLKLVLVVALFTTSMMYVSIDSSTITSNLSINTSFHGSSGLTGFGSAMIACLWCFDGWADLNFLMEEILGQPEKQLPRVVLTSLAIVTTAYVLANVSYFSVLDKSTMIGSHSIAVEVGRKIGLATSWGERGAVLLSSLFAAGVAVSTTGSNNGSILTGGRAFYAVARSGRVPRFLAQLNTRGMPWSALLAQCLWTLVLLMLPGASFATLLDYFGPTSWMFYAVTSSSLIVLRIQEPDAYRPYKIPLYPLPPLIVICIAAVILGSSLLREPVFCSLALGFVALSVPVFHIYDRYFSERPATSRFGHRSVGGIQLQVNVQSAMHY